MNTKRRRISCLLVFCLSLCHIHALQANNNNVPVREPAVRPKTRRVKDTQQQITAVRTVGGGVKGVYQHHHQQSNEDEMHTSSTRQLGEDKGKTDPVKGDVSGDDDDDKDKTPPPTTSQPTTTSAVLTMMPSSSTATKAPTTTMTPTFSPTDEITTTTTVDDTTVMLSLSIGVAPNRRRRRILQQTSRLLTPDLQNLVADTVTEILHGNNNLHSLEYDQSLSSVKSILFGVDVSWWLHNVTYQIIVGGSTTSVAQVVTRDAREALTFAMNSGVLLSRLRESVTQILAVCEPGKELNTPLWKDEEEPTNDVPRDFPGAQQDEEDPTHVYSLSLSWQARQWAGAGILATTLVGVMLLFRRARKRRQNLEHQVVWGAGALGTEQDVNKLLNIGWKSDGEEVTAIFDKEKENYNDNDSMLMGGVQQTTVITNPSSASRSHTVLSQSASHHTTISQ